MGQNGVSGLKGAHGEPGFQGLDAAPGFFLIFYYNFFLKHSLND
jgi:hypothetical protein